METVKTSLVVTLLLMITVCHTTNEEQENVFQRSKRAEECPTIVSRSQWGARAATSTRSMRRPVPKVFIHHTVTGRCYNLESCKAVVKSIQNVHMNTRKWNDIGYNFLVGDDGRVYEGRGWNNVGAHARAWNPTSYGIAILGNFQSTLPSTAALNAVTKLIACGRTKNTISAAYTLHGHRDGVCTTCPGDSLYNHISKWPKFGGKLTPRYC